MAFTTGSMSSMVKPPPAAQPGGAGTGTGEEESLAVSLMMLSRGIRQEPRALCAADVAAAAPAPPYPYVAGVPAGVAHAHGLAWESVFLLSQAPVVPLVAAGQSSASVAVAAPSQPPATARAVLPSLVPVIVARQVPAPVVVTAPIQAPSPVTVPRQAYATVLASTQAQEPTAVTAPSRASVAAPIPETAAAPRQAPAAGSSQLLHECPICGKTFNTSRGLNTHINCHPDGRLHPCEFCTSTFPSTSALRSHVRRSQTCGGNNRRRLGPVAAAAIAWHKIDLNMPEI